MTRWSRSACVGTRRPGCAPRRSRGARSRRRAARTRLRCTIVMSVSVRACVYSSASSYGSSDRDVLVACRAVRRGTGGPGAGTPRPGARRRRRARRRRCRSSRSLVGVDAAGTRSTNRSAARRRARARGRPTSTCCPPRGVSRSACTRSRTASSRPAPNQRSSSGVERQLVRGARDLRAQHERVLRVHDRALGRAPRQLGGMRGVPLVELVVARDEHRDRAPAGAPGAAGLLPHRRERAREAVEDHRVETADVDAELERVRRRDAEQPPARDVELERAPLLGRGTRRGTRRRGRRARARASARRRRAYCATTSAPRRLRVNASVWWPARTKRVEQLGGLDVGRRRARPSARRAAVVASTRARARRAATRRRRSVRRRGRTARSRARPGCRSSRSRSRTSGRRRSARTAGAAAAARARRATAEDAAQRVQLVDDDVAQPHEERRPALVRRQDPHVQHLGVGEHDVGVLARPRAVVARGVAVVGDGAEARNEPRAQRAELILGERLGREDQQRGVAPVLDDRRHDRHLVAERLSRRGPGRDDDAAAVAQRVDPGGLMRVQLLDPARRARAATSRCSGCCERRVTGRRARAALRGGRSGPTRSGSAASSSSTRTRPRSPGSRVASTPSVPTACAAARDA